MPIELPPAPTQAEGESLADFQTRHLIWWREGDLMHRVACYNMKAEWLASIEPNLGPTLTRIADAWDAFDVRLGELAGALGSQSGASSGFSETFMLQLLRLVLDKPEAPAP